MLTKIDAVYKALLHAFIFVMFALMTLVTLANVVARFVFNRPIFWSAEMARYSFVWIIFLGAALAARQGGHIGMEALQNTLPPRTRVVLKGAINCLIIMFLCVFTIVSFKQAFLAVDTESAAMQIPMFIPYLALPFGGIAMIVEVVKAIRSDKQRETITQEIL
jgi:C4-dicarboxylate transporter DctQ subunit